MPQRPVTSMATDAGESVSASTPTPREMPEEERPQTTSTPDTNMDVEAKQKTSDPPATSAAGSHDLERGYAKPFAITRSTGTSTTNAKADRPLMPTPAPKRQVSYRKPVPHIPVPVMQPGRTREE